MGITLNPSPPSLRISPDYVTQSQDFMHEADDISFSDGCCTCPVGIIDIVDSTKITAGLGRRQMSKYYCFFINWATAVVRGFGGKVVKNTGDGLLFYFPPAEDSEDTKAIRDCLSCSIALSTLHPNISMRYISESLPELNYRISLDYGEVSFAKTTNSALDIFGNTVNICAKINSIAAPNTVVVGGDMYQVSKNQIGYSFQQIKKTISVAGRLYPVYSVSEARTVRDYLTSRRRVPASMIAHTSILKENEEKRI